VSHSGPADWERLSQRNDLSEDDVWDIHRRLARMDGDAPWTRATLDLISKNPGLVSTDLAEKMGMERFAFKKLVYKLKRLGLTHSLEVGYRLSPRGEAYLRHSKRSQS
jgi:hypothetical protein